MFKVLGVDQSVQHTGVCILSEIGELIHLGLIEPKKIEAKERLTYIRDALEDIVKGHELAIGVLEGYSYGSVNKKFMLGEVGAVVKLVMHDHCKQFFDAAPKQLKKFVTGRGSASKEEVMQAIKAQWKVDVTNDNLADAYGLAQIARQIHKTDTTHRNQLSVLKMMTNKDLKKVKKSRIKPTPYKDAV